MELIRQVGDDNHPLIKLKVDYPSKHPDKKLPILDFKIWVEQRERERDSRIKPDGVGNSV